MAQDPADFDMGDEILIVALDELQRNVRNQENAKRISVRKDQPVVVGDDLENYVRSWNDSDNRN